jgi:hypothetical protein
MTALATELETFHANAALWRTVYGVKACLVKGAQLVGVFDTAMDAIAEGGRLFGNDPFLVRRPLPCQCHDFQRLRPASFPVSLSRASVLHAVSGGPVDGMADIDTGAHRTFIAESVAQKLRLPVINYVEVSSPVFGREKVSRPVYPVRITAHCTANVTAIDVQAASLDYDPKHCLVLIGLDVLRNCVVTVRGLESFEIGEQTHTSQKAAA